VQLAQVAYLPNGGVENDMSAAGVAEMAERNPASATVKIDPDLLRKAKQVAVMKDVKLSEFLDRLLRGPIEREHAKMFPDHEEK
jgi:hypothetical protein